MTFSTLPVLVHVALGGTINKADGEYHLTENTPVEIALTALLHGSKGAFFPERARLQDRSRQLFRGFKTSTHVLKESDELTNEDMLGLVERLQDIDDPGDSRLLISVGSWRQPNVAHFLATGEWVVDREPDSHWIKEAEQGVAAGNAVIAGNGAKLLGLPPMSTVLISTEGEIFDNNNGLTPEAIINFTQAFELLHQNDGTINYVKTAAS